ncbi:MAG: hypothetical protein IT317_03460 [Anaerolineales bacterium]|nr:hypothetical protein [Anaerolineales bacterium]
MENPELIRERYLRDGVPTRLGGLAANLRRIQAFTRQESGREIVASLLDESKHFIEWTAREAELETAAELVALQGQLARWQTQWPAIWPDPARRAALGEQARQWSDRVLELSGLLAA